MATVQPASIFPLAHDVYAHYMTLEQRGGIQAEYIWIGGSGNGDLRSKTKTIPELKEVKSLDQLPVWNYDGSSTNQAPGRDSEVYLNPVSFYPDPFRRGNNVLVLCEAVLPDGKSTPIPTNSRRNAAEVMAKVKAQVPWFGIEQEYTLFQPDGNTPLGWPRGGYPDPKALITAPLVLKTPSAAALLRPTIALACMLE